MSLHFAILFWLALIFLVATTFILVLMKNWQESKRVLFKFYCHSLYFWIPILIYTFIFGVL